MEKVKYVLASNNKKKLDELQRILGSLGIEITTAAAEGFTPIDPVEDGETFAENARIKAKAFAQLTNMPSIADDSGLCVDALGGAPGVITARYAGDECDSEKNMDKLLVELADVPDEERAAQFVCSMCLIMPSGEEITADGVCEGFIAHERTGNGGFGYDPIFLLPDGRGFAEISPQEKDAVSHRGKALRLLAERIAAQNG